MHIVVIGAGALGTFFGSRLEEAGAKVTFLVRDQRAEKIKQNGLQVKSTQGDYQFEQPNIVTDVKEIEKVDLVLLSVKGYHLSGALPSIEELVRKGAYVLPILNGIEHIEILQRAFGKDVIIGGLSYIVATLDERGHVIHSSPFHKLVFGPLTEKQTDFCQQLEDVLSKTSLTYSNSESILIDLWEKYTFITATSGITTATNLPVGPIREETATYQLVDRILQEMQQLAIAESVAITPTHIESVKRNFQKLADDATSSMHQDRRKGIMLEVEHLHGGALRLAQKHNLKIPYIETIYGMIKPFENREE